MWHFKRYNNRIITPKRHSAINPTEPRSERTLGTATLSGKVSFISCMCDFFFFFSEPVASETHQPCEGASLPCGPQSCAWSGSLSPNWARTKWRAASEPSTPPPDASSRLRFVKQNKTKHQKSYCGDFSQTLLLQTSLFILWKQRLLTAVFSSVSEPSHFMKMRTSVRRCPARYPYVAPAPRAAAVSPCGGSSSALLLPIKKPTSRTSFKYQNPESNNKPPRAEISPVRTGARLFDYFKTVSHSVVGGWVFSSNTLTSGVHSTMLVSLFFLLLLLLLFLLLSVWCVNPLSSWSSSRRFEEWMCVCVRTQPSQPVSVNLPFYARIQRADAVGVGGEKLIGIRWEEGGR